MTSPLIAAEQALLGAVLLDPHQLTNVAWLEPDHFYRPAHRALFAALRTLREDGHPGLTARPVPLSWVSDAVAEAGKHVRGVGMSQAHTLVAACPHPQHAPVYGRMVLEGAIRRTVTEHAVRLHQAARAAVRDAPAPALHQADVLAAVISDMADRWGSDLRPLTPAHPTAARAPEAERSVLDTEQALLGLLIAEPKDLPEVTSWLTPDDFAAPAHGHLYRCLAALHHRGEPIDRITVSWEAQHRGLFADGTLTPDEFTTISERTGAGSAEWLGERVLAAHLTRAVAAAARTVQALAVDESLTPGRFLGSARHALDTLDTVRTRWSTATNPPPQTQPAAPHPAPDLRSRAVRLRSPSAPTPVARAPAAAPPPPARHVRHRPR